MQNAHAARPVLRIVRDIALFILAIFLVVGVVHLAAGWKTARDYGSGLVWAGGIGILFLLVNAGWRDGRRQDLVALTQIMREHDVFYQLNRDNSGRARFLLVGLAALSFAFVIGLILLSAA